MSEKDIEIWWYEVNKNEFHASKQPIILDLVNTDKTVVSHKFKHSDKNSKYFVDYENDDIIRPLCIVLPQISGYINILVMVEKYVFWNWNDNVLIKHDDIWKKIKKILGINFITSLFLIKNI